jgi:mitogen-activated protein kinase kinase kinase
MYMSPEMIKNDRPSRLGAMDIWAMGCVILEAATGRKPWSNLDNEWFVGFLSRVPILNYTINRAIMFHIGVATKHPPLPDPGQLSLQGIDFIKRCLVIDGLTRPTAIDLQSHPWILEFKEALAEEEFLNGPPSAGDEPSMMSQQIGYHSGKFHAVQEDEEDEFSPEMETPDQATPTVEYPPPKHS